VGGASGAGAGGAGGAGRVLHGSREVMYIHRVY